MKPDENFIKTIKKVECAPTGCPPTYGTSMRQVSMIDWEERAEKHEATSRGVAMIMNANALHIPLADKCVHTIVTSPPYYCLRDYGVSGQIGLEQTPDEYVANLVAVFRECKRVLRDDGTCWINLGDSYAWSKGRNADRTRDFSGLKQATNRGSYEGIIKPDDFGRRSATSTVSEVNRGGGIYSGCDCKPKDLIGIPWMVAFALRADGWYLRQDIIWAKPNPMPESVKDRCTKSHEYIFLLSKSERYYYDNEAIKEPAVGRPTDSWEKRKVAGAGSGSKNNGHNSSLAKGKGFSHTVGNGQTRNKRSVWTVANKPYKGAHFATFSPNLIEPCIKAGCPQGGIVFDPFVGSGTTVATAIQLGRKGIGIDLSLKYLHENASARIDAVRLPFESENSTQGDKNV